MTRPIEMEVAYGRTKTNGDAGGGRVSRIPPPTHFDRASDSAPAAPSPTRDIASAKSIDQRSAPPLRPAQDVASAEPLRLIGSGSVDQRDSSPSSNVYKQLADAMRELDHEIDEVSALDASTAAGETKAEDSDDDDDEAVDSPEDLQATIRSLQSIYKHLDANVVELRMELETKESVIESLKFQLAAALEENRAASLEELRANAKKNELKIKDLKSLLVALEEDRAASLEELEARVEEKESIIQDLESQLAALEENTRLGAIVEEKESNTEDLESQLAALEERRAASREEKESKIHDLERRLAAAAADRDEKDQEVRLLGNYIMRKIEEEAEAEETESKEGGEGDVTERTNDRLLQAMASLEDRYKHLDAEVAGLKANMEESECKIKTLESKNAAGEENRALSEEENARLGTLLAEKDLEVKQLGNYIMRLLGAEGGGVEAKAKETDVGAEKDDIEARLRAIEAKRALSLEENARLGETLAEKDREVVALSNYVMKLLEAQTA